MLSNKTIDEKLIHSYFTIIEYNNNKFNEIYLMLLQIYAENEYKSILKTICKISMILVGTLKDICIRNLTKGIQNRSNFRI